MGSLLESSLNMDVLSPITTFRRSQLCTLCLGSEEVLRRGRRRITQLQRSSSTSTGRLNLRCPSTTRLTIMARSTVLDANALLKNVVPEYSWLPILTVSTVESVVSLMCFNKPEDK